MTVQYNRKSIMRYVFVVLLAMAVDFKFNLISNYAEAQNDGPALSNTETWIPIVKDNSAGKPLPPMSNSWKDPNTAIFVGISHYRDQRCAVTLKNIYSKAKNPLRIYVGENHMLPSVTHV